MHIPASQKKQIDSLTDRFPELAPLAETIYKYFCILKDAFISNHRVFIAGNGGSASDANHIVGELMKGFKLKRPISRRDAEKIISIDSDRAIQIIKNLQCGLPIYSLTEQSSLVTAYINDVSSENVFAQQVFNYGSEGDIFWGITTSGNSQNIVNAAIVAKAKGLKVLGLTGEFGGEMLKYADCIIKVPSHETYLVQEYHLPIYHCLCLMLEEYFYEQ